MLRMRSTPLACFDAPGSTNDRYFALGDIAAPFGLDDNTVVYGDPTTGTSNDSMYLIETNGTSVGGYCQNATDFSGTWNRMTYNGYYLDLHGVGGGDTLQDGGGSGDTYLYGEAGGDLLIQSSSIGSAKGGDDNDFVLGFSSGAGDDLSGGNGIDCLYDTTNTAALFSCGGTAGDTRDSRNSGAYISGCPASGTCW